MARSGTEPLELLGVVTDQTFDEDAYLRSNPDVAAAVSSGQVRSGRSHFTRMGKREGRLQQTPPTAQFWAMKQAKLARIAELLEPGRECITSDTSFDFLTASLRSQFGIVDAELVSAHNYDADVRAVIEENAAGLVLDCGAGSRPQYFPNVVNFEIAPYLSTDVVGVAEDLPFTDDSFDAVLSLQVLEHVKDPFACAREMLRVLKPGGTLLVAVPLLQPVHAYPNHYYNMTAQGVLNLFDGELADARQFVYTAGKPIASLTWILRRWAESLPDASARHFKNLRVSDLLGDTPEYLQADYVRELPESVNFELASGTMLIGTKAAQPSASG